MVSWTSSTTFPPFIFRISFMGALFLPVLYIRNSWLPAIFTCFLSISQYGISYSYLPESISIHMMLIVSLLLLYQNKKKLVVFPNLLYFLPFYVFIIDLLTDGSVYHIFYILVITCSLSFVFNKDYTNAEKKMSIAFISITVVLCYYFLFFRDRFTESYGKYGTDLERVLWTDPNYLGCVIGMGTICCGIKLTDKKISKIVRLMLALIFCTSLMILIMNASRGSLLAVLFACSVLFIMSPVKIIYKLIFISFVIFFIYVLYNNSYFELLEYRIENDYTGSGRTIIWDKRLTAFFEGPILNIVFGYGHERTMVLGTGSTYYVGCHNDYIAFLVEYGVIGFLMFLGILLFPIMKIISTKLILEISHVFTIISYIAVCSITLEPFTLGRIPYYMFYLYAILVVNKSIMDSKNKYENSFSIIGRSL